MFIEQTRNRRNRNQITVIANYIYIIWSISRSICFRRKPNFIFFLFFTILDLLNCFGMNQELLLFTIDRGDIAAYGEGEIEVTTQFIDFIYI